MRYQDQIMKQISDLQKAGFTPTDLYLGNKEYYALRTMAAITQQEIGVYTAYGLRVHMVGDANHLMVAGSVD